MSSTNSTTTLNVVVLLYFNFYENYPECLIEAPDSLVVTWSTWNLTDTVGHFGLSPSNMTSQVGGMSVVFEDGGPEKRKQFIHTVTLKLLAPNSHYCKKLSTPFIIQTPTLGFGLLRSLFK